MSVLAEWRHDVKIDFISLFAPWKVVALSLYKMSTFPRLLTNLAKAAMNASVVKLLTSSKWTAFVFMHTNNAMYAFSSTLVRPLHCVTHDLMAFRAGNIQYLVLRYC